MNWNIFAGWRQVFRFTLKESVKVKSFKVTTVLLSIILFAAGILVNVLPAIFDSEDGSETCLVKTVYVYNETDVPVDFQAMSASNPAYGETSFQTSEKEADALLKELSDPEGAAVLLEVTPSGEGYSVDIKLPPESFLSPADCSGLLNDAIMYFQTSRISSSGIAPEALAAASQPIYSNSHFAGEDDDSFGQEILEMIFPMLFSLVLYVIILLYGQSIAKSVISEKSSKLMEFLLVTIKPYGLIAGKILAMFTLAILQFLLWVAVGIGGFLLGDLIAGELSADYSNFLLDIIAFMRDNGILAFSVPAIILSIVGIALAFLFYCCLAGIVSSSLSSTENLSSGMGMFQLPVIASFLLTYMAPMYNNPVLATVIRYVPFTSAFTVPCQILLGTMSLAEGALSLLVLLISTIALMVLTGKLYKARVFYRGKAKGLLGFASRR